MTSIEVLSTYRPPWRDSSGRAVAGPDEDATTFAVAAASGVVEALGGAERIGRFVVVTRTPALLEGPAAAVVATALGLSADVPVEMHLGGAPSSLDVVNRADEGTVVVGVDVDGPAAAAAVFVGREGAQVQRCARVEGVVPARVRAPGQAAQEIDDPRLVRELGWRQGVLAAGFLPEGTVIVGPPPSAVAALGGEQRSSAAVAAQGASAPLIALGVLAGGRGEGPVIALEGGTMTAAAVTEAEALRVIRDERGPQAEAPPRADGGAPIPASAAAFTRAFHAKIALAAGRCQCGALDLPPRYRCLACGREEAWTLERLPRSGRVYTAVTIHTPVPNRATPYSLAIVDIADTGVRHLAPVTGAAPGSVRIGDVGRLVLRRIADREVGPDYGWAFMPDHFPAEEDDS